MSGGSLDYLFAKRVSDAIEFSKVARVAQLLREVGTPQSEMLSIRVADLHRHLTDAEAEFESLSEVMRVVEWWQSGDYGKEAVDEACREWLENL